MNNMFQQVCDFQKALGVEYPDKPTWAAVDKFDIHHRLLEEELREYYEAYDNKDIVNLAEELSDVIYIVCGIAHRNGIPLDKVFDGIHSANMRKINIPGGPVLKNGKLQKPKDWKKSDTKKILEEAGYTGK